MAADTQLSDEAIMYRVQKIDRLEDGTLIGGAGDWGKCWRYIQYLKSDAPPLLEPKLKGATLLRITPDGVIWFNEGHGFYPILNKSNVAIGSGAQAAMALMDKGLTAVEAIKAVTVLDPNTSNPVQVLELAPKLKASRRKSSTPKASRNEASSQDT